MKFTPKVNTDGVTLLEFMIAVFIMAILINMTLVYLHKNTAIVQNQKMAGSRARVASSIRRLVTLPSALRNSALQQSVNPELYNCVYGNNTNMLMCPSYNPGTLTYYDYPFTLFSPMVETDSSTGQPIAAGAISTPMGATPTLFFGFDSMSSPCTKPTATCGLEVFTSFRAICGPKHTWPLATYDTCPGARTIEVNFLIQVNSQSINAMPGGIDRSELLTPIRGSFAISTVDIQG